MKAARVVSSGIGLALCFVLNAYAASFDDDYKRGETAWRTGDMVGAMSSLRKAADQGHAPSQALLADILDKAEFNEEAIEYYRKSADQGNAQGQYGLGTMYLAGEGVNRDVEKALFWFTRAAEKNHVDAVKGCAQIHLARLANASANTMADPTVISMIERAADHRYLPAMDWLAGAYRNGAFGMVANAKQAEVWEAKARDLRKIAGEKRRKR